MSRPGPFRIGRGGRVDRARPISFSFDGRAHLGFAGDSLASALMANGVRVISRSLKFRRPRGVYSCGVEEPNALVQLSSGASAIASARAPLVELYEGLEGFTQSGWPRAGFDVGRVLDFVAPLWAAGFYNKAFMWPSWHAYEWLVRRMAGLGRVPPEACLERYDVRNLHCDVLVIGGGVAGLSAAAAARRSGARVVLAEQQPFFGGHCSWDGSKIAGACARSWVDTTVKQLGASPDCQVLTHTTAAGCYDHKVVALVEYVGAHGGERAAPRERLWITRAKQVIFATGAIEQPLVFCNNDRPGVMLAGAAHQYLHRYGVAPGRRVVIATNNDSAYCVARDLHAAGIEVLVVADTRDAVHAALVDDMYARSIRIARGSIPTDTSGFGALSGVSIGRLSRDLRWAQTEERLRCDALLVSGGWNPTLHLYSQAGGKLVYCEQSAAFRPVDDPLQAMLVGAAAGIDNIEAALHHADSVGTTAAADALEAPIAALRAANTPITASGSIGIRISPVGNTARQWIDLRHDVTVADLELAIRENYCSIEHVKRYTTVGMSVDQGKTSSIAAVEVAARLRNVSPAQIGHTTFRPPFSPITLGALAGRDVGEGFAPHRQLPLHEHHLASGAILADLGEWKRPVAYPRGAESHQQAVAREARNVRTCVGLFEGSSLGKIEVHGPDACEFLNRFYINNLRTLKPGRARYGLMLRDSGVIFDDGIVTLLDAGHWLITTTSANATRVGAWLEEWRQCEWPQLRVAITPVMDQWATLSLAGPRAREVLSKLEPDIDVSNAAFPHLAMREGRLLGAPARIFRVSFTGELTYEINVPAASAAKVWEALQTAGEPHGLMPFGVDALVMLRLEKGYILVGTDTDGTTIPEDIGWGKVAAAKAEDFIGKRSLSLPENVRPDRLQLVGLAGLDNAELCVGSHLRLAHSSAATDGWVTSAGRSHLGNQPIALALLRAGRQYFGHTVTVHDIGRTSRARVVEPPFFDAPGERMNA